MGVNMGGSMEGAVSLDGVGRDKKKIRGLEIPLGRRTKLYRFFEILPGVLSYGMIAALFIISWFSPFLGAVYLLILVVTVLVKAIVSAVHTVKGYKEMMRAQEVDWAKRLSQLSEPHKYYEKLHGRGSRSFGYDEHVENLRVLSVGEIEYPKPEAVKHLIIMAAYNEGLETLVPSLEAVVETGFDNKKIIFTLAYEERGGEEMERTAKELKKKFAGVFYDFVLVKHPKDLPREIQGKGPNLTYAGEYMQEYLERKRIKAENVIVTSLDSDNRMSKHYLDYVAYEFIVHRDRQHLSYQPISLFTNNIWDAPAPMRVIAVSNSFFNVISTMRPHLLRNFASHSQPMLALQEMGFWSKRTIVEDGHQYWRSLFFFDGDYDVLSIKVPIGQDVVMEETIWKTLKAQFMQLRRWDYGASDVAYVGVRLFSKERKIPFFKLFPKFWRLLDGHVTLAALSPIVAFGGWVPMLMNQQPRTVVAYSLPSTVGTIQTVAMVGLFITILFSLKMLPPRPAKYKRKRTIWMVLQWVLMPIIAIVYQSAAAFYAQTRLMIGRYM
ncbi:hypothetical protein IJ096_00735 [Candidatus Saccharibacteria bacterium]|nr:hypothetical protein [Candidatus Saccharibacteria bacterium]